MRILHFTNYADLIGGAEVYAHSLVKAQRERGHEVALFGASQEGEVDRPGLRVIQRPMYDAQRLVQDPAAKSALREFVQRFQPAVIHAHNLFSVALEVVQLLGQCGAPVLQTVHDYQLLCPNSWCVHGDGTVCAGGAGAHCFQNGCERNYPYDAFGVLLSAIRQRMVSRATRVALAPSSYLAERLRAHGWERVHHLPYFIDFTPAVGTGARSECELLYVGRLEREKGVETLLEALPEIRSALPRVRLTVVGSGTMEATLRSRADQLTLGLSVRFLSRVPRAEVAAFYANSSLAVLPSVWIENSPLVAYECLLSGLPMAGSAIGGIPELIGEDCGFTFPPRNPGELARAVLRFLRLPLAERERMSAAARQRGRSYGKEAHLAAIDEHYRQLLSEPAPSASSEDALWQHLLPILQQVGTGQPAGSTPLRTMQIVRAFARTLGLPKFLDR